MRGNVGKRLRAVWEIAVVVFGPTKTAPIILRWWPIALTFLGVVLPIVGLSVPGHLTLDEPAWWIVIGLAILVLLCLRALWIFHSAVAREFPRAEIEIKPAFCMKHNDPDVDLDHTVLFFDMRVTNREPARRLDLVFDMSLHTQVGGGCSPRSSSSPSATRDSRIGSRSPFLSIHSTR